MTTTCPACNKSVDPLRSRFVGVVDGKVVAYCSAACMPPAQRDPAAAAVPGAAVPEPSTPARTFAIGGAEGPPRPVTPAPGVPILLDSGPVIQIVYEPASGAVTGTPAASPASPASGERPAPRAKQPEEVPIATSRSTDPAQVGAARTASEPGPGTRTRRSDTSDPVTTSGGAAPGRTARALPAEHDEAIADAGPPRKRRASLLLLLVLLLGAGAFLAYQYLVKHDVNAATSVSAPLAPAVAASVLELPRAPAAERAPAGGVSADGDVPATVDVDASVAQARATLHGELIATSQRLQRLAAAALARTQDPAACDVLAVQLGLAVTRERSATPGAAGSGSTGSGAAGSGAPSPPRPETSEIARLDLAYSLARGGDKRGRDALAAALASQRPDVRDEAARLLALLGDNRAVPHLTDVLTVPQRRLGAAEHLAHLAEPHAVKVLEALRADARTSADDKARATIALGIAGHPDVAPALRDMLGDPHFNAFAAAALAELKDAAARPVLEHQLESPMLRVRAARALRRLEPDLDPRPLLPHLLPILKTGRDTDQVQVAEVILLLAGPATWSAYD
jgi:hypothetical protein